MDSIYYPDNHLCLSCLVRPANLKADRLFRIDLVILERLSFLKANLVELLLETANRQGDRLVPGLMAHQFVSRALALLLERTTYKCPRGL